MRAARPTPARLALLLLALPALVAANGDYVRVILEQPAPTPFSVVRYEVIDRGPAVSAVHRRELPGHPETLHAMGLVTAAEWSELAALVRDNDGLALPSAVSASPAPDAVTWRVELSLGGKEHTFRVTDPIHRRDRRYFRLIDHVRRAVTAVAGELPFRNVFYDAKRLGWVNILSIPVARVTIDGFDTKLETPIYSYELGAGEHTIRLRSADGTYDRKYTIKVEAGGHTRLAVDLR